MFLSVLMVDVGSNPDRLRPGRTWLRNAYRVHQRLCMAFADAREGTGDVHGERSKTSAFLFRVEADRVPPVVVVQSGRRPDWDAAFRRVEFLMCQPHVIEFEPNYTAGEMLGFRLRVNPTKSVLAPEQLADGAWRDGNGNRPRGRLAPITHPVEQRRWLREKSAECGFEATELDLFQPGRQVSWKTKYEVAEGADGAKEGQKQTLASLDLAGKLRVTDTEKFRAAWTGGIGRGKGLGFGMLALSREYVCRTFRS